jgi:hypothetical protein
MCHKELIAHHTVRSHPHCRAQHSRNERARITREAIALGQHVGQVAAAFILTIVPRETN